MTIHEHVGEVPAVQAAIRLPQGVYDEIVAHARAGKPEEVCGIVRGRGELAIEAVRGRNIAPERIENYQLDPQTLLMQFEFEDAGDEMVAIYHSHPVSVAYPSATDAWNAHYPDCIYLICSLEHDDAPVVRAFRLMAHFVELDLPALAAALPFAQVRPGLYGYYQVAGAAAAPVLRKVAAEVAAPFYVVYQAGPGDAPDGRAVAVAEVEVVVEGTL